MKVKHESPVPPVDPQWENSPDPAKRERWARDLQQRHAYVKAENPTLLAKKLDHSERDLNRQKYRRQKVWLQVLIPSISAGVVFALIMYVIFK